MQLDNPIAFTGGKSIPWRSIPATCSSILASAAPVSPCGSRDLPLEVMQ